MTGIKIEIGIWGLVWIRGGEGRGGEDGELDVDGRSEIAMVRYDMV